MLVKTNRYNNHIPRLIVWVHLMIMKYFADYRLG